MWVEHLARGAASTLDLPVPRLEGQEIDWREMLEAIVRARLDGAAGAAIARAFHRAFAQALADAVQVLAVRHRVDAVVFSGGVMQNALLADDLSRSLRSSRLHVWVNHSVPPNDGASALGSSARGVSSAATPLTWLVFGPPCAIRWIAAPEHRLNVSRLWLTRLLISC